MDWFSSRNDCNDEEEISISSMKLKENLKNLIIQQEKEWWKDM